MYETVPEEASTQASPVKNTLGKVSRGIYDVVETLVIAIAIVVFIYLFVASPHEVIGRSMEPNFWNAEYLLADKVSYKLHEPKRGDVVIFEQTETADYIKRVIGLPGETVELRDGKIWINNKQLDETPYLDSSVYSYGDNFLKEGQPYKIPSGKYFVCGDNRGHSSDSRAFGPIEKSRIKGRAVLIYWPFSQFKIVPHPKLNIP